MTGGRAGRAGRDRGAAATAKNNNESTTHFDMDGVFLAARRSA